MYIRLSDLENIKGIGPKTIKRIREKLLKETNPSFNVGFSEPALEINRVYMGRSELVMNHIPDNSIDLVVTSPPYDDLREYQGYAIHLETIIRQLYRVIKEGGVVVWVVGDQTVSGSETGNSFKQALKFMGMGFNLHDTMVYAKNNGLPMFHNAKRYNDDFEYAFIFSKGSPNTFNPKAVNKVEGYETGSTEITRKTKGRVEVKRGAVRSDSPYKLASNIWYYTTGYNSSTKDKYAFKHDAVFPELLAEDHILTWSNEGDIVLDPFCGSGTTLKMAKVNDRGFIGIDVSELSCRLSKRRVHSKTRVESDSLFGVL